MKKIIFISIILLLPNIFLAQKSETPDSTEVTELNKIYKNLEYDTRGYDDVKEKWLITDRTLIRAIFNQYIAKNSLRVNNTIPDDNYIKKLNKKITGNEVYLKVTKRYFDDEIEKLEFKLKNAQETTAKETTTQNTKDNDKKKNTEKFQLPAPIDSGFYLKDIVGENIYKQIQNKTLHTDITLKEFNRSQSYNYDIYLNALEPEVMFWQTSTADTFVNQSKYLLSFSGKWGNDYTNLPGWFASDYVGGIKLAYKKDVIQRRPTYSITLGTNFKSGDPFPDKMPAEQILFSGRSFYFNLTGQDFLKISFLEKIEFSFEGKIRFQEYTKKKYKTFVRNYKKFYTAKNYLVVSAHKYTDSDFKIFNSFNLGKFEYGGGVSFLEMNHLQFLPMQSKVKILDYPQESRWYGFIEVGVAAYEGLFTHKIDLIASFGNYGYKYLGLKLQAMLGNTFGVDIRFFNKFGASIPAWRNNYYFVFSPIIRINY